MKSVPGKLFPLLAALSVAFLAAEVRAGQSASTNYAVISETSGAGGGRSASANYTQTGNLGGVVGLAIAASPPVTAKAGYVAQLTEVSALEVVAAAPSIGETSTVQLGARQILDDATTIALDAGSVAWSIVSGPLATLSGGGLATAETVFENSPATVQGGFGGLTDTLTLTVLETTPDNFRAYAGDALDDFWQVSFFGIDNPDAGPLVDVFGNGLTNQFKYIAGLDPTDPEATFTFLLSPVPGQPGQRNITFGPVFPDRTYTVRSSPTLGAPAVWTPVTGTTANNGALRTLTDPTAGGNREFYRVDISKP